MSADIKTATLAQAESILIGLEFAYGMNGRESDKVLCDLIRSLVELAAPASSAMAMQAVAHVANKFGDPEAFAERELRFDDVVIQRLPIGTQLFVLQSQQSPVQASEPTWADMTDYGQVRVGDFISFFIGDNHYDERVVEVLNAGTDKEELIYNKKKNFYVISKNVITDFGNVKKFRYFSNQASDAGRQG